MTGSLTVVGMDMAPAEQVEKVSGNRRDAKPFVKNPT